MGHWYKESRRKLAERELRGKLVRGVFQRWFIANADDDSLAWSGNRWVHHVDGLAAERVPIESFDTVTDAAEYADENGIEIIEW